MAEQENLTVLIVDDQSNWRDLLADLLADEYEVTCVGSYGEGLKALDQDPPFHVAVVDIRMNDKDQANEDGLLLIAKLGTRYTNSIVVTGYPTVRTVREALHRLDAFDYIEKYPADGKGFDRTSFRKIVSEAANDAVLRRSHKAYVVASFEEIAPREPLEVGRHYTLSLTLEALPKGEDSLMINVHTLRESTIEATIDVVNMRVQPGEVRQWMIPAGGNPVPLLTKLIPKKPGRQRAIIYLRVDGRPVGGLEKEIEVVEALARINKEI